MIDSSRPLGDNEVSWEGIERVDVEQFMGGSGRGLDVRWTGMKIHGACETDKAVATIGRICGMNGNPTG